MNKGYIMITRLLLTVLLFASVYSVHAQEKSADPLDSAAFAQAEQELRAQIEDSTVTAGAPQQHVEMADVMRSEGKIYVVVGIVLIVLVLMLVYLFTIDRNVKRLEKQLSEKGK
jgi:hypothetical protein